MERGHGPPEWVPLWGSASWQECRSRLEGPRLCPQDIPQWPQGEYLLGGPGGCPPHVLGLHLSMGYGDPCPLLSGTRGPKSPLARLTAITWHLMASLGQLLRGQGNRRELQVLQLVGPELQKLLTKVRSFCKLTHQDRCTTQLMRTGWFPGWQVRGEH